VTDPLVARLVDAAARGGFESLPEEWLVILAREGPTPTVRARAEAEVNRRWREQAAEGRRRLGEAA
jgi:hypothetical protein